MPVPVTAVDPSLPTAAAPPSPAALAHDPDATPAVEFDRQVEAYLELGFATLLGVDEHAFRSRVARLRPTFAAPSASEDGVPFVLVLPEVDPNDGVPAMRRGTKLGISVIDRDEMATYKPLPYLSPPAGPYLLRGIDVGSAFCGVRPEDALNAVRARGRSPLTIHEGVALTVVRPDMLRPNKCYSLMGSRTGTNQRVPAIWISERRAKLGWCWDRNPHTWLGAASAAGRTGPAS